MGLASADHHETPLLGSHSGDSILLRTGTLWTAVAHIITGMIGSGVLSLAWSMAQLGWIAGPLTMILFASVTLTSTYLLCDCYRSPDPEYGPDRNRSYLEAAHASLGKRRAQVCGFFVQTSLYGIGIAYTVTTAISMRAIQESNCYHKEGHDAACTYSDTSYMLIFGVIQLILSQIPDFHNIQWLSILAAIMSISYSSIGFGLGIAKVIANGYVKGTISGISTSTTAEKVWLVAQALGDVAYAYPFSVILIEIQDTLKSPPPENQTMKNASSIGIAITTLFYLGCAGFGYGAFGDNTPGNLLTGFGFYEPYWLIDFANACIVLHLVGAYQVFSQPLFAIVEKWVSEKYPDNSFLKSEYSLKMPMTPAGFRLNLFRLCFRTGYVVSTTGIAMIFPYFNQIIGFWGGLNFWPLTIYFPVEMHLKQRNIQAWTIKWVMLKIFSLIVLSVSTFALIGSAEGLITAKLR